MNKIKIIIATAVVSIISFIGWKGYQLIYPPPVSPPPYNRYTRVIQGKIDDLKKMPDNLFCSDYYKAVQFQIEDFYKDGSLGETSSQVGGIWTTQKNGSNNIQWHDILSRNLYSAYVPKFTKQTMYIFNHSEWKEKELKFIRSELINIKKSSFLELSGPVADSLKTINTILAKYDEINSFIYSCKTFSYTNNELTASYPNESDKVHKSRTYLAYDLDNIYVNNCERLKVELQAIPKILFDKHISYLLNKITINAARYKEFDTQAKYYNSIYKPLHDQLDAINIDIYGIDQDYFDKEYESLEVPLTKYNFDALSFFL